MGIPHFIGLSLLAYAASTYAATCYTNKPIQSGGPSGDDYAAVIRTQLASICGSGQINFPPTSPNDNTWNYGSVNFRIRRADANTDLSKCNDAFNNIIDQCVKGSKVWGGEWALSGATYTIENSVYPQNPLASLAGSVPGLISTSSDAITAYTQDPNNSDKAQHAAEAVAAALALATVVGSSPGLITALQSASTAAAAAVSTPGAAAAAALAAAWETVKTAAPSGGQPSPSPTETTTTTTSSSSSSSSTTVTFPIKITNCGQINQTPLPPNAITSDSSFPIPTVTPNKKGTNLHVNKGCVVINDSPRCASGKAYNVASGTGPTNQATFYAQFNGDDKTSQMVTPGCKLTASWPSSYGDIYFGADNCLYDSSSKQINSQCCSQSTTDQVINPYYNGQQPPTPTPSPSSPSTIKVTNCPSACFESGKSCCALSGDARTACAQKIENCGINILIDNVCGASDSGNQSDCTSVCGSFSYTNPDVGGARNEQITQCLVPAFGFSFSKPS